MKTTDSNIETTSTADTANPASTIETLEAQLEKTITGRGLARSEIHLRMAVAEGVVSGFVLTPLSETLDAAVTAYTQLQALKVLLPQITEQVVSNPVLETQAKGLWFEAHRDVLVPALSALLDEKLASRPAFLAAIAAKQGRLHEAAALAVGGPNEAAADEALVQAEAVQFEKGHALELAQKYLREIHNGAHDFLTWSRARQAVNNVDFTVAA